MEQKVKKRKKSRVIKEGREELKKGYKEVIKQEIVKIIERRNKNILKRDVEKIVGDVLDEIKNEIEEGKRVEISGLGDL